MTAQRPTIDVVCFTGNSGLTDYSVSLCRELLQYMDVRLVTADTIAPRFRNLGFEILTVFRRSRHLAIDYLRMMQEIIKRRPNYVLLQSWIKFPAIDALLAPTLSTLGIRVVITVHDFLPHSPKPWSRRTISRFYRSAKALIVHSERTAAAARELGIKAPILTVPHGLYDIFDLDRLDREAARRRLGVTNVNDFVVLFFGNLTRRKGLFEFIGAAKRLHDESTIRFIVAGKSNLDAGDLALFEAEASAAKVVVHDHRISFDAVQIYFAAADIVALPYLEGTTSGVLKLALAFGRPVVATDIGDLGETVTSEVGVLIGVSDLSRNLANAILEVRSKYPTLESSVQDNRKRYEWRPIAERYANFLGSL